MNYKTMAACQHTLKKMIKNNFLEVTLDLLCLWGKHILKIMESLSQVILFH